MTYIDFKEGSQLDAILIGRITIDINPVDYFKPWAECETFKKYAGGSAANLAVGLARLGKRVGFIGKISDDQMGDFCEAFLKKEKIDTSHITRCTNGESMGLAFTEVLSESESGLIMYRTQAADLQLSVADIDEKYIKSTKMLIVTGTALSCSPSREAVLKAVDLAVKNGITVVFDVDYRNYTWKSKDEAALYYSLVAKQSDIIMGSREEYDILDRLREGETEDRMIAQRWFAQGVKIVIIKHGKDGSTAYTDDGKSYMIKPFPVKALKGFGGGDGYGSSFLNGILEGWDIMDCLEHGSASAAMLIGSHGCAPYMPTLDELEKFMKEEKEVYGDMIARK